MFTIRVVRLTVEALRRLRQARDGRVHSAFARTVNVKLNGLGDAGWVSIHSIWTPDPIPSPFGLACRTLIGSVLPRAPVRVMADAIEVGGSRAGFRLQFADARVVDTTLPETAPAPSMAPCLRAARAVEAGLLPVVAALLADWPAPADPLARHAAPALARLNAATAARDAAGVLAAARPLLGLGPGLTPSGDDCLVGWVAGAWTAGPAGRGLVRAVGPALVAAAAERAGALSRAFLAAAVAGQVAEPVADFVAQPDASRLAALKAVGATSGGDVLAGYLVARHALARLAVAAG